MSRVLLLACLCSLAFASLAQAAAPATVTVRVEGLNQTLLGATTVTTNETPVVKDGNPSDSCSGSSAAGALEQATSGSWNGEWFSGIGYSVETILGETHAFEPGVPANYFWSYWLDNKDSSIGICSGEVSSGDSLLFFPECFSESEPNPCPAAPDPLGVQAPAVAEAGAPFSVTVVSYANATGVSSPAVGALVSGGGSEATTNSSGVATLSLASAGNVSLHVSAANSVRTEANVCVHKGNDGNCGTTSNTGTTNPSTAVVAAPPLDEEGGRGFGHRLRLDGQILQAALAMVHAIQPRGTRRANHPSHFFSSLTVDDTHKHSYFIHSTLT